MSSSRSLHSQRNSSPEVALNELVEQAGAGSNEATRRLHDKYAHHVFRVIRKRMRMGHALRRHIDSTDLVQETWRRVFETIERGGRFATEQEFVCFLLTVAENQFRKEYRAKVTTGKRSVRREVEIDLTIHDLPSTEAGPTERVETVDESRRLLTGLPEDRRSIMEAVMNGDPLTIIAKRLNVSIRTVERLVERLRKTHGG